MKKIIGILRPFDYTQTLFVYENGNKIDMVTPVVADFPAIVLDLANKYEVSQVDLTGPKQYARGIKEIIENLEMTKYSKQILEINII